MEDKNKYLVIGGNGKTGRKIVERLINLGKNVRVGSRRENPPFDWDVTENWSEVLKDIDMVYVTFQPDLAVPGAIESIEKFSAQAVKSGVKKIILLSGKGEKEAELCEQVIKESGIKWTIVRASWFNQNFSESFFLDPIKAGYVELPKEDALIPFVDTDDIADVVVASFINDIHDGQTYELTGPRLLTFKQIVEEISNQTGRDIKFNSISMDEYKNMLKEYKVPEDYIWLISYLFTEVLVSENSIITSDIKKVLGREAKDFSEYVKETALTGVWNSIN